MAKYQELSIDKGSDVKWQIHLVDANEDPILLTPYTISGKLKKEYTSTDSADIVSFTCGKESPDSDGVIYFSLSSAQTGLLDTRRYVYDIEVFDSDNSITTRVLEGIATITPGVN